jgi:PAS domain S-box-containing protein
MQLLASKTQQSAHWPKSLFMKKSSVLIVEDEAVTAMALQENLRSNGYEITDIIDRGENVMDSVYNQKPDLILMDIKLKGEMTGIEAANQVTKNYDMPVIYLTANSDEITFKKAKVTHPYGFILKPFNERELKIGIEIALHKKELEDALERSYKEMESKVESRTAELRIANEQLHQEIERRKVIEEQVKNSEKRYRNFISHSQEGIWRMEFNEPVPINSSLNELVNHILYQGHIEECNDKMAKMYGYNNAASMHGKRLVDLFDAHTSDEIDIAKERTRKFIKNNFIVNDTISTEKDKGGNSIYISNSTTGDVENGKLTRIWGIQREVTKQILAQTALEKSRSNLSEAQRMAQAGDWYLDFVTNKFTWSDQTFRLFGYVPNEIEVTFDLFINHVHKEDIDLVNSAIKSSLAGQLNNNIDFRIINKDGDLKIVTNKLEVIADSNGKSTAMRGVMQDITEQKMVHEKLILSEQRFRDVASISSDLVWEINNEGKYTYCSDRVIDALGYTIEEMMTKTPFDLMTEEDGKREKIHFLEHIKEPRSFTNHENWNIKKNGELVCMLSNMVTIFDQHGNPKGMRGIDRDITKAKIIETTLKSGYDELDRRVKERTKHLKASNDELKELAYTLSHDLKAPLRGIKTLIDWVHEDNKLKVDKTSLQNFQLIDQKVKMLYSLINDIIEFSKIGDDGAHREEVNFELVLVEVVEMLNIPASVELVILEKLPTIISSKVQMVQVFQNLISNAIKYNDNDKVIIEIGTIVKQSALIFFVRDNGQGIDPKHHERIFKIFKTLAPKDNGDNTGIGLSIVRKIITKHNGRIWVESELGKGSCFYFTLNQE